LAASIAQGVLDAAPDADVQCYDINEHDLGALSAALNHNDGFLVGSPTINRDAVAPIWHLLANIEAVGMAGRPCAVFGSYGWSGEAAGNIASRLASVRAKVAEEQLRVQFTPSPDDLARARRFGADFAAGIVG
jgi:flavorubredoxin